MPTTLIRNCRFAFRCHKQWNDLVPTKQQNVRFCDDCSRKVFYCSTDAELVSAVKDGQCVAVVVESEPTSKKKQDPTRSTIGVVEVGLPAWPRRPRP